MKIHGNAHVLSCGVQGEDIVLWAFVNSRAPEQALKVVVLGTGHPVPAQLPKFIGTVQLSNGLVFHVFA